MELKTVGLFVCVSVQLLVVMPLNLELSYFDRYMKTYIETNVDKWSQKEQYGDKRNKATAMIRRKSPRSENIYLIENHCQANISK